MDVLFTSTYPPTATHTRLTSCGTSSVRKPNESLEHSIILPVAFQYNESFTYLTLTVAALFQSLQLKKGYFNPDRVFSVALPNNVCKQINYFA